MPSAVRSAAVLMDDADRYSPALYCGICCLKPECGGLHCKASPLSCDEFCCGGSEDCTIVCRSHPDFLEQISEVGGLSLTNLPHVSGPAVCLTRDIVPLIYHGSKRGSRFWSRHIALRLADLIDFERGRARYRTRDHLCDAFKIDPSCGILLTGVDHDPVIERIWRLEGRRPAVFRDLARIGIDCATTPNFSMILDVPRTDNLHSMKRIAIVYQEMCEAGLPTALHVNGRTERDFGRWGEFLAARPYIDALAYEFITGSGMSSRLPMHLSWLNKMISGLSRRVTFVVRGNPRCLDLLPSDCVPVYIETTSFVKTVKRQEPVRVGNRRTRWITAAHASSDLAGRLLINSSEVRSSLLTKYSVLASAL